MAMKKGLGRGLDALLGDYTQPTPEGVQELDIHLIDTNAGQPRKDFDQEKLQELADSIRQHGVVQPILLRQNGERYVIVAGERRFRAARLAGLEKVPAIVKDLDEAQVMEVALIENLQREDLNPIEEAAAIRFLMQQHDLTQEEVSKRLSKSRPAIANSLRLLSLPEPVQAYLRNGKLQAGHARALAGLQDPEAQAVLADKIVGEGLSVRAAESLAREQGQKPPRQKKEPPATDPDLAAAEASLREWLGTKVSIQGSSQRGRIIIEYYNAELLQGIYDLLRGGEG
ncbi:MAG TPA: ParB/RepB/Spo0J family partition protein [Candidatus Pelethousia gallinarum]|nr:ParB/RepB/Spo0J family partition protein [Candidatus Pelethousia gallinarum]